MRISVVLCVYNGENFLGEQLQSIERQDRRPDELVVGDDQSTDGSIALVQQFASRAGFPVRILQNDRNLGVTRNFEQGIGLAEGDLIVTADQDDLWYPGKLARIESVFRESTDVGLVFSDADLIDCEGKSLRSRLWSSVRFSAAALRELNGGDPFGVLLRRPVITGATMAFRSDLRRLVLPISPRWLHDEWIGLMIACVARVVALPEPLMQYRRHANNQVGLIGLDPLERARASLARPRDRYLARADDFEEIRAAIASRLPDRADLLAKIDQKIDHCRVRGLFPESRWRRIPRVLRELASLRYFRYSGSTLSFARDLLARD